MEDRIATAASRGFWCSGSSGTGSHCIGPEDGGAKDRPGRGVETRQREGQSRAQPSSGSRGDDRSRSEAALGALADHTGPEVDVLTTALARAKVAASATSGRSK